MNTISIEKKNYINQIKSEAAKLEMQLASIESGETSFEEIAPDTMGVFESPTKESTVAWLNRLIKFKLRLINDEMAKIIMDDDSKCLHDVIA